MVEKLNIGGQRIGEDIARLSITRSESKDGASIPLTLPGRVARLLPKEYQSFVVTVPRNANMSTERMAGPNHEDGVMKGSWTSKGWYRDRAVVPDHIGRDRAVVPDHIGREFESTWGA